MEVITDVLSGSGDSDGDVVVGQKSAAGDEGPWVLLIRVADE
jgi:hypothetical protein